MTSNKYRVSNGTYSVTVSKTGYNTITRSVTINNADKSETMSLSLSTYTIDIHGIIPGSWVKVTSNGTVVSNEQIMNDTTQIEVNHGQSYTITLTKEENEYKRWDNQVFEHNGSLESHYGKLTLTGNSLPAPGSLQVKRDGAVVETISSYDGAERVYEIPGAYTFEFSIPGYRILTKSYTLLQGEQEYVYLNGRDAFYVLTLNVTPDDATISVKDASGNSITKV